MIDFIFNTLSAFFQMNLRDPHDVPFAMPLMMGAIPGLTIGFYIVSLLGNEEKIPQSNEDESIPKINPAKNADLP
ncbi:MAG: hypothetical protein HOP02_06850 [Methylococcaceae bacterium]|nr:hypothetical protein [Methylococcaceae bacterium]